jgi:opacity protein-like surface antigen
MLKKCILIAIAAWVPTFGYSFGLTNWYLRGFVGPNFVSIPSFPTGKVETDIGYAVGGSIGYRFPKVCRFEGELSYRSNALDQIVIKDKGANFKIKLHGALSTFAYMGNLLFDLPINCVVVPYVGVGLGGCREWGSGRVPILEGTPNAIRFKSEKDDVAFQVIAGLNLLHCHTIDAGIEYHFFDSVSDVDSDCNHTLALTCRKTF